MIKIEESILTDEDIEKAIISSLKQLEIIFGEKILHKIQDKHQTRNLESDVKRIYEKTDTNFKDCLAIINNSTNKIKVHKLNIILQHLKNKNHPQKEQIHQIQNYFENQEHQLITAINTRNTEESKKHLKTIITILEKEKDILLKNKEDLTTNKNNFLSIHNIILHELTHTVFNLESQFSNKYKMALSEGYSFAIQSLNYLYNQHEKITAHQLEKETQKLKFLAHNINRDSYKKNYEIMQYLIQLIGISILSDVIDRQEGQNTNQQLLLQTYKTLRLRNVHQLVESQIGNIRENDLKNILKKLELEIIKELGKEEKEIKNSLEKDIHKLEIVKTEFYNSIDEIITHYQKGLAKINTKHFLASADLLEIMTSKQTADEYRTKYKNKLVELINHQSNNITNEENRLYVDENNVIEKLVSIISFEETEIKSIITELKN